VAETSSNFRDTLVELIDTSPQPMDHPTPDQWLAYHRGALSAEAEARLQEHLVRCRGCFDLAEGAAAFAQPDEGPNAGQEVETAALWRLVRPQLDSRIDPPPKNVRELAAGPRRSSRRFRLPLYLAATFFVALVGLTAWNLSLQSRVNALRAPRPNASIVDIPAGERDPTRRELTLSTGPQILVLHPAEQLPVYRLVFRDTASGKELSSNDGLKLDPELALTLYLPEGLKPGRCRMELVDGSGGKAGKVLQAQLLRVAEAGRGQ
jgi:hypothetical protein